MSGKGLICSSKMVPAATSSGGDECCVLFSFLIHPPYLALFCPSLSFYSYYFSPCTGNWGFVCILREPLLVLRGFLIPEGQRSLFMMEKPVFKWWDGEDQVYIKVVIEKFLREMSSQRLPVDAFFPNQYITALGFICSNIFSQATHRVLVLCVLDEH